MARKRNRFKWSYRRDGEASIPGKAISQEAEELAGAPPPQAMHAESRPAHKTGPSPEPREDAAPCQEGPSPSQEVQQSDEAAELQKLADEQANFDELLRATKEEVKQERAEQNILESEVKRIREQHKQEEERMKKRRETDGAMGEAIERALQRYSRHQALAYIGICGPSDGPYNEHAAQMVEDWTHTYETVLSQQQRETIMDHFGERYVEFWAAKLPGVDPPETLGPWNYGFLRDDLYD